MTFASVFRIFGYMAIVIVGVICLILFVGYVKYRIEEPHTQQLVDKLTSIRVGEPMEGVLYEVDSVHLPIVRDGSKQVIVKVRSFALPFEEVHTVTYQFDANGKLSDIHVDEYNDGL